VSQFDVGDVMEALKGSALRLKADSKEVLDLIQVMRDDLSALEDDLQKNPTSVTRVLIIREIESIRNDRPKHILAAVEAKAGVEVRVLFEEGLSIALSIALKVLLK
jgi:hypothetical protein